MMEKHDSLFMKFALDNAEMSHDNRAKVGACFVKDGLILSHGWNGRISGEDNVCQDENNVTLPSVMHAEENAILRAAKHGKSLLDSTLYCTHTPCEPCARRIVSVGIKRLVYYQEYRDTSGVDFLRSRGVEVFAYPYSLKL